MITAMTLEENFPADWPSFEGPRPEYEKPPVIEVALSVQFQSLDGLTAPYLGKVWEALPDEFRQAEEQPPLTRAIETFETKPQSGPQINFVAGPGPVRCWFKNDDGSQMVQVQMDRFVFNWRRFSWDQPYPRYEFVRDRFVECFQKFSSFIEQNDLGKIVPDQCEVTYVNHIFVGEGVSSQGALNEVLAPWGKKYSDTFLGEPEDIRVQVRHQIHDKNEKPIGRLYVNVEPRFRTIDQAPLIQVNVMARGAPADTNLDGILGFFALGREYIVRGFTSITSKRMHKYWGRKDV